MGLEVCLAGGQLWWEKRLTSYKVERLPDISLSPFKNVLILENDSSTKGARFGKELLIIN